MTQYYVSTVGLDTNDGLTSAGAWATLAKPNTVIVAGDTVNILDGTYTYTGVESTVNGTSANRITYRAVNARLAKIIVTRGGDQSGWHSTGDYQTLDGIDFTGNSATLAVGIMFSGDDGRALNCHVHNIKAANCSGFGGAGIGWDQYNLKEFGVADGCEVHEIGDMGTSTGSTFGARTNCFRVHGIYTSIPNVHVINNLVYRIIGYGYTNGHCGYSNVCSNNTFFSCGGTVEGGGAVLTNNGNCVHASNNNEFINNIIWECVYGLHEEGTVAADTTRYANNYIQGCTVVNVGNIPSGNAISAEVSGAVPGFKNYQANGTGDYNLTSNSVCRNSGAANSYTVVDYLQVTRPQESIYDLGAYEYVSTGAAASPRGYMQFLNR